MTVIDESEAAVQVTGLHSDFEASAIQLVSARVGWTFSDPLLLRRALAHRSWCAESGEESNERLEFLGDAVLGVVVTSHIYRTYPTLPEGDLAKLRSGVVNSAALAEVALELELGESILLGKGELSTGGQYKTSIVADALEAVIGAVYLDGGFPAAEGVVMRLLEGRIWVSEDGPGGDDYKTRLQELVARNFEHVPVYETADYGLDHDKDFTATVIVMGRVRGRGAGKSKKQAEQAAAQEAWRTLSAEVAKKAALRDAGIAAAVVAGAEDIEEVATVVQIAEVSKVAKAAKAAKDAKVAKISTRRRRGNN